MHPAVMQYLGSGAMPDELGELEELSDPESPQKLRANTNIKMASATKPPNTPASDAGSLDVVERDVLLVFNDL